MSLVCDNGHIFHPASLVRSLKAPNIAGKDFAQLQYKKDGLSLQSMLKPNANFQRRLTYILLPSAPPQIITFKQDIFPQLDKTNNSKFHVYIFFEKYIESCQEDVLFIIDIKTLLIYEQISHKITQNTLLSLLLHLHIRFLQAVSLLQKQSSLTSFLMAVNLICLSGQMPVHSVKVKVH